MQLNSLFITFFISLFLTACSINSAAADNRSKYTKAQRLIDEYSGQIQKLREAHALFNEIESSGKNLELAYVGYGRLVYKSGYISTGKYAEGTFPESRRYFDQAISVSPDFFDAYFYGSYPYIFSKDFKNARRMARKAQTLSPGSEKVDLLFAGIAKKEGNLDEVIKSANNALGKSSDKKIVGDAYALLANAYKRQKKIRLADTYFLKIINLEPESAWARINYSDFLVKHVKDFDQAIEQGEMALKLMDFPMGHIVLADAYYGKAAELHWGKKKYQDSKAFFEKSIHHNPAKANAHYGLGRAYYLVGHKSKDVAQIRKAKASFESALNNNPSHKQAKENLASVDKLIKFIEQQ